MYRAADAQRLPLQALIVVIFLYYLSVAILPLAACPTVKAQPCVGPAVEMLVVQVAKVGQLSRSGQKQTQTIVIVVIISILPLSPGLSPHSGAWLALASMVAAQEETHRGRVQICSVPIPPLPSHFQPLYSILGP